LATDYPGDRPVQVLLGQVATAEGQLDEAAAAFDRALALDAATPRVHALRANVYTLQSQYAKARDAFQQALQRQVDGTAPGQIHFGLALTYVYEGNVDQALTTMRGFLERYRSTGGLPGLPEVFIWNAMARVNLEHGRLAEAMAAYEKGFESVPGSAASERDKKLWLGRLHHGRGRTLAKMGKAEEAWKEAELIKKMIDESGEEGKQFLPAYHYLAGYIKLEAGDGPSALEHLKQSNPSDPFHQMLLGRAYQATGDTAAARKIYQEVLGSTQVGLERALAYPEAKKRLASL
jgi:tetratricopeptide (TPR) repeat protein